METELSELQADEKQLDKNFKKEFADTDQLYARLLHLYRLRTSQAHPADSKDAHGTKCVVPLGER